MEKAIVSELKLFPETVIQILYPVKNNIILAVRKILKVILFIKCLQLEKKRVSYTTCSNAIVGFLTKPRSIKHYKFNCANKGKGGTAAKVSDSQ